MIPPVQPSFAQLYGTPVLSVTEAGQGNSNSSKIIYIVFVLGTTAAAFLIGMEIGKQMERKMREELKRK